MDKWSCHLAGDLRVVGLNPSQNFRQFFTPDCKADPTKFPPRINSRTLQQNSEGRKCQTSIVKEDTPLSLNLDLT